MRHKYDIPTLHTACSDIQRRVSSAQVVLDAGDDFFVLASDGVWGWLSNKAVVRAVATTVKHVDFGPKRLVAEAYEAGSDDNITALVVYLKPPADIRTHRLQDLGHCN